MIDTTALAAAAPLQITPLPESAPSRQRDDALLVANLYGGPVFAALPATIVYEAVVRAPDAVTPVAAVARTHAIPDPGGRVVDYYA